MSNSADLTPRQGVLLMFIGDADSTDLDPIRLMKGLFIVSQEAPEATLPAKSRYSFEPYLYGPYSQAINDDLRTLVQRGLAQTANVRGRSWHYYSLTPRGKEALENLHSSTSRPLLEYVGQIRQWVTRQTFESLLGAVYERYPEFARKSLFRGQPHTE